ncbi:hypothetical protein LTR36_005221 [Oleoguttula mirabilis]|uniref:Uncharacterized protein n=1 Tax=Oleoguttula mirabilis TaxID=1507867 RepID=A0AAV9JWE8_9PEZI|nr:hypothetical protein LTR36_005221 [Oleoguttula mirabilis]
MDWFEEQLWALMRIKYGGDSDGCETSRMHKRREFLGVLGLPTRPQQGFQYVPSKTAARLAKWWFELEDIGDSRDRIGLQLLEVAICEEMKLMPTLSRNRRV